MRRMLKSSRPNHEGIPEMVLMFGHLVRDFRKWDRLRIFAPPSLYKSEILKSFFKKVVVHLKYPRLTNYFRLFKKYPKLPDLILKIFFFFTRPHIFKYSFLFLEFENHFFQKHKNKQNYIC